MIDVQPTLIRDGDIVWVTRRGDALVQELCDGLRGICTMWL